MKDRAPAALRHPRVAEGGEVHLLGKNNLDVAPFVKRREQAVARNFAGTETGPKRPPVKHPEEVESVGSRGGSLHGAGVF